MDAFRVRVACGVGRDNKVTLRPARLILRWVTARGYHVFVCRPNGQSATLACNSAFYRLRYGNSEYRPWAVVLLFDYELERRHPVLWYIDLHAIDVEEGR